MTERLAIVFAGTPAFAVPALEALRASRHELLAVYSQPDRPAGRGRVLSASPVKGCALELGLAIEQPPTLRSDEAVARLASLAPDLLVVVAYGLILPQPILDVPRLGCLNIHASLLPRWRGAAPIQRAIQAGDAETGISIMRMEAGLDTGPVLLMRATPIGARENTASLHDRLARLGADALLEAIDGLDSGRLVPRPQPETGVRYATKIAKSEALIDWSRDAGEIDRQVRAFNPWPVAETRWAGAQLRVWEAQPVERRAAAQPGQVIESGPRLVVAAGGGALSIERLQLAGRKAMTAAEFLRAEPLAGQRFGT